MKPIELLDNTLLVEVRYVCEDQDLADNICIKVSETCPEEEKIFMHDESHLYITQEQAVALAEALLKAVEQSGKNSG
ncbi:MAG: hypothetical protein AAGU17_09945 [Anaerolineaceae bacterium]|jgi:hypothetical protein